VSQGRDPAVAVAAETAKLEEHARKDAKTNLRLWSPARYREAKRGSENVAALSCLVLDYDAGVSIEDAAATWEEFFHCLHTTWSHREDRPRFRVILPLARPVAAADWTAVWAWAARQADDMVDHALKGAGATFALPATPSLDSPRVATVHAGELLDPELVGIPLGPVDPTPDPSARPVRMLREDAKREVLDVEASDP
jgi:putative DNA primase/helicase